MEKTVVLLLLCMTFIHFKTDGLNCRENPCLCCKSGECTRPDQHVFPCNGCKDGYTNPSCYENCPTNCVNCSQLFYENDAERICYQCKNGFYNGQYKDIKSYPMQQDCSLACVNNCDICTSYYNCISCKENHYLVYGRDCIQCPLNCSQCLPDAGCVACTDGYVWTGRVCEPCKPNCKRCELSGECTECYSGFNVHGSSCNKCPSGCLTCDGLQGCIRCQEGYVLKDSTCRIKNRSNCSQGNECDKSNAYGSDSCEDGWSGKNCDQPCDSSCLSCNKENPAKCLKCANDRYGQTCGNDCSRNCINNTCNDQDGICIYGCLPGFRGKRCDCHNYGGRRSKRNDDTCFIGCFDMYRGDTCVCSINCTCEAEGVCLRCVHINGTEGFVESKCEKTADCLNGCLLEFAGYRSCTADGQQTKDTAIIVIGTVFGIVLVVCMVFLIFKLKRRNTQEHVVIPYLKCLPSWICTETESEEHEISVFLEPMENKVRMPPMETRGACGRTELAELPLPALSYSLVSKITDGDAAMPCLAKLDVEVSDISAKTNQSDEEKEDKEVTDPLRGVSVRPYSSDDNDGEASHTRSQSSWKCSADT